MMQQAGAVEAIDGAMHAISLAVEVVGVAMLTLTAVVATVLLFVDWRREGTFSPAYKCYRRNLGRGILLGLEFLVIGDIIGTVAMKPTFAALGVLAIIVLIRTFLSFALEVEIEGRFPWRGVDHEKDEVGI